MIKVKFNHHGNFKKTENFLNSMINNEFLKYLDDCGKKGVAALSSATPVDTGKTASSWSYSIASDKESTTVTWSNSSVTNSGIPIVILLKYGHATGTGGYVQGRDFIDPTILPIFDSFINKVWTKVVTS